MNGYKISRLVLGIILITSLMVRCSTPPISPSPNTQPTLSPITAVTGPSTETIELFLGRGQNRPYIDQRLFTGSDVTEFSFNLDVTPAWPTGLVVELFDEAGVSVGEYYTATTPADIPTISGNSVRILVTTRGNAWVTLDGNGSELHITDLTVLNSATAPATPALAQRLELGVETLGYTGAGTLLFFIDVAPTPGQIYSLYLSPFAPTSTPAHNVNARLGWALGATTQVPVEFNMLDPYTSSSRGADTGIYHEMNVAHPGRLYLIVAADPDRFFRLTVQRVHGLIGTQGDPIIVELDDGLDGIAARVVSPTGSFGRGVWASHYSTSLHEFIRDTSNYNDRGSEILVMASAGLLAATEGYFRFDKIRYHYGFDSRRDYRDIVFHADCGRAWATHGWPWPIATINNIDLWRQHIRDDPIEGANVLVHEWGHYYWHMTDEYIDDVGAICLNSVMGHHWNTFEFCGDQSHFYGTGDDQIGMNCAWSFITAQDGVRPPRPQTSLGVSYPQNQANYLDVLHKLEAMMVIDADSAQLARSGTYPACQDVGGDCTSDTDCNGYRTSRCDTRLGRCIPDEGEGMINDFCTAPSQCKSNRCILYERCVAKALLGEDCWGDSDCKTNICDLTFNKCVVAPQSALDGWYCTQHNQCNSLRCDNHQCANANISSGADIGNNVTIGDDVTIENGAQVGNHVTIGDGVTIEERAQVGNGVTIGDDVTIKAGAQVGNNVLIGKNVTVHYAVVQNNVTISDGATVRAGANIGDSANIHAGVTIGAGQVVPPNTVVCCSCTGNLYDCDDFDMWPDAYCCYLGCKAITGSDVHNMDGNNNGMPCEP